MIQDDSTRHMVAYVLLVAVVILPFAINWWVKRDRPIKRFKYPTGAYGHGAERQRLNWFERVLAHLRLI